MCKKKKSSSIRTSKDLWALDPESLYTDASNCVYLIFSIDYKATYIGQTHDAFERAKAEYRDAYNHNLFSTHTVINHRNSTEENGIRAEIMARDLHSYAWIPIITNLTTREITPSWLGPVEHALIKTWRPTMNNDAYSRHRRNQAKSFKLKDHVTHSKKHPFKKHSYVNFKHKNQKNRIQNQYKNMVLKHHRPFTFFTTKKSTVKFYSLQKFLKTQLKNNKHTATINWTLGSDKVDKIKNLIFLYGNSPARFKATTLKNEKIHVNGLLKTHIHLIQYCKSGSLHIEDIRDKKTVTATPPTKQIIKLATKISKRNNFIRTATFDHIINTRMSARPTNLV